MTEIERPRAKRGAALLDADARRIGTVDAVFVDYLLVRTRGLPPVDLYIPTAELEVQAADRVMTRVTRGEAYERWHRPLKSVAHD